METIKVFIASSEELKIERREFSDMILELNRIFKPRGFEIGPEKWEWLDSSMGPVHKQEEYNRVLKTCEICLVLYWRKFGSYTKIELDTAYTELCAGRKPCKLYVFFKDTRNITPELQHFKSNFESEYGHFFCRFKNVDTLRLRFLLQLENYLNELWGKQNFINIKIKNSRVEVDGIPFANLNLIPFASSNKELQNLLNKIKLAQENVLKDPNNEDLWQTLHDLQVKRDRVESSMLDTARLITQWSVKDHSSHRLTEAIRLFETGDNLGAKNILNSEAIKMDAQSNKNRIIAGMALEKEGRMLVESNRKALETNVKEWQLRIRAIQNEMAEGWFAEVVQIYDIAIDLARNGIENIKFARLLREYADFLRDNNQYHLIRSLYSECLDILRFLVRTDRTIEPELAMTLHNAAIFHTKTKKYVIAEKEYKEAFKMYAHIAKHNPQHIVSIITVLNNMANLYFDLGRNGRAEIIYKKVLEDYRRLAQQDSDIFGPYVASTLTNLARVHDSIKNFSQAEAEFNEALGLQQHFAIQNPEIYEPNIATTLANMANLHNNMQEIEQAEVEYRNSLDIYRRLAKKKRNAYEPYMGMIFYNLANMHSKIQEKLVLAEKEYIEAEKIFRCWIKLSPIPYEGNLAILISSRATMYFKMQKFEQAEGKYIEAIEILRRLSSYNQLEYEPDLAKTLTNIATLHFVLHRYEKAREEYTDALRILRRIAELNPKKYKQELLNTLYAIAFMHNNNQEYELAEQKYSEALEIYYSLDRQGKMECEETAVMVLYQLADLHNRMHKFEQAEEEYQNVLNICHHIAYKNRQFCDPYTAAILKKLATLHYNTNKLAQSEKEYKKALEIYHDLVTLRDQSYEQDLAEIFKQLASIHMTHNMFDEANIEYQKALDIYLRIVKQNPQVYEPYLAEIFNNIGTLHINLQKFDLAINEYNKALDIYHRLAKQFPMQYTPDVAMVLYNQAGLYQKMGDFILSEKQYKQALKIYRHCAKIDGQKYEPNVAMALYNLANLHCNIKALKQAEEEFKESLSIYRHLAKLNIEMYEPYIAMNLNNLGNIHRCNMEFTLAIEEFHEAYKIYIKYNRYTDKYKKDIDGVLYNMQLLELAILYYYEKK